VANGKNRNTRIYKLQDGDKVTSGDVEVKNHITSYYKSLFGPYESSIKLDESRTDDITRICQEGNESLVENFTMAEVKHAVFQMEHNKAPSPDGFSAEFYHVFCDVICDDLMALLGTCSQMLRIKNKAT
jgi:hypothetical protein